MSGSVVVMWGAVVMWECSGEWECSGNVGLSTLYKKPSYIQ